MKLFLVYKHESHPKLSQALQESPELTDISSDWQADGMMAYINVDRDSASRLGISMSAIDNALYNAFGQRLISTIYTQANQYRVVLEQNMHNSEGLQALSAVHLTGKEGAMVPLLSIASVEQHLLKPLLMPLSKQKSILRCQKILRHSFKGLH